MRINKFLPSRSHPVVADACSVVRPTPPTYRLTIVSVDTTFNAIALRLGQSPDVRRVQWEADAGSALAVLPGRTVSVDRRLS